MSAEDLISLKSSSVPVRVAATATVVVFLIVGVLAFGSVKVDGAEIYRWQQFMRLPPNAMADTLSGIGATLTLIWVVASVFQQSLELRAQREEFRKMAIKQAEQGASLSSLNQMASAEQHIENYKTKLANLRAYMAQQGPHRGSWYLKDKATHVPSLNYLGKMSISIDDRAFFQATSDQLFLRWVLAGFENFLRDSSNMLAQNHETISFPQIRENLLELRRNTAEIAKILSELSGGLASTHELESWMQLERCISAVLDEPLLWTDNGWSPTP